MTKPKTPNTTDPDMEALHAELAQREAEVARRERALQAQEAASQVAPSTPTPTVGLAEADLDLSTADEEARQGRAPEAAPEQRKAYGQWLRTHYPGRTPRKDFHVTLKKKNTTDQSFQLSAVDQADARRQAYQQAGIAKQTEGFNAIVVRV